LAAALVLALVPVAAAADTNSGWICRAWQSDDGLPNNSIVGLAQTSDGFLWVVNASALSRFDGVRFESFSLNVINPDREERIGAVLQSRSGGLWLGTTHGAMVYLKNGTQKVLTNNLPDAIPQTIIEDGEGAVWVTFHGGIIACRIKNNEVTQFSRNYTNTPNWWPGTELKSDATGRVWYARNREIGMFKDNQFVSLLTPRVGGLTMAGARDGGMWVCQGTKLFKCDPDGRTMPQVAVYDPDHANAMPTVMFEDRKGALWIGTAENGLFRFDGQVSESIPTSHSRITSLMEDREGNMWIGTGGGGLDRLQPRTVELEGLESGLPFVVVQSICEAASGAIWAVTQNGLVARRTASGWTTMSGHNGWPEAGATCITADRSGRVWLGTQDGSLFCWRDGQMTGGWLESDGLAVGNVKALVASAAGDLWIAGGDVLQRFHADKFETVELMHKIGTILAMIEDPAGNIWISTSRRFTLRINGNTVTNESKLFGRLPFAIRTMSATSDGTVWASFDGHGLGWVKNGQLTRISAEEGLLDNYITEIVADNQGWLWFGSDHGIFKVKRQELEDWSAHRIDHVRSVRYSASAGLPGLQATLGNSPAVLCSRDGRVWLPMSSALAVADPNKLHEDTKPPPVLLKRVTVDDRVVASYGGIMPATEGVDLKNSAATLRLPPGHRRLEFEFTAVSFVAPENVQFRYQLEPIDEKWIDGKTERQASYSRLPAGDYRFRVRACNSDGIWSENGAALEFMVTPFVWETWWFRLSVLAAFTAGVFAMARYVSVWRMHSRLQKIEQQAALDKSRLAGMSEVAASVLHNVGNILNSVNVSSSLAIEKVRKLKSSSVDKIALLLKEHAGDLPGFFAKDPRGRQLPDYLSTLALHIGVERDEIVKELESLENNIEHIKQIVASQQNYAQAPGVLESFNLTEVVEDAIRIHAGALKDSHFEIIREYQEVPPVTTDKHKVLQILNNLVANAKSALETGGETPEKRLVVRVAMNGGDMVRISVIDNGIGIMPENQTRIFQQGAFMRTDGRGFGLHSGANAAKELGGSLTVYSDGLGKGATFTLELPRQASSEHGHK
jgi:ligand-binding sensor domain-containing protein/signal transduction histidine kinase